jgi:hypothetical protein
MRTPRGILGDWKLQATSPPRRTPPNHRRLACHREIPPTRPWPIPDRPCQIASMVGTRYLTQASSLRQLEHGHQRFWFFALRGCTATFKRDLTLKRQSNRTSDAATPRRRDADEKANDHTRKS